MSAVHHLTRHGRKHWEAFLLNSSNSEHMNVNGTALAPIEFSFPAPFPDPHYEVYVTHIVLFLVDNAIDLTAFGNVAALANGFRLILTQVTDTTTLIDDATTLGEIIKQVNPGNENAYEIIPNISNITHDGIRIRINIAEPFGLWFERNEAQRSRIVATVQDNLTGLTDFTIKLFGYKE